MHMIFNQLIETIQNELLFFFQKNMHEKNGEELNGELVIDIIKSNLMMLNSNVSRNK